MLQQTRAQTVIPYYRRFLERFPDVHALAEAREADVLALWSGLGYYSRARNLQRAAQTIVATGGFPRNYDDIRELPGVGPYTAAAVASIAFGAPHAVVDGNVLRVISRVRGDAGDIQSSKTRTRFQHIADEWLEGRRPGLFNQAMMELGAIVCLPRGPRCSACPVVSFCEARQTGRQDELPVKGGQRAAERVNVQVLIAMRNGSVLLRRRATAETLMAGFWELPAPADVPGCRSGQIVGSFRHTITHRHYTITVLAGAVPAAPRGFHWRRIDRLAGVPLTTITRKALGLMAMAHRAESAVAGIVGCTG